MTEYAAVILVTTSGAVAVQLRDDKPGIREPGQLMIFGGEIKDGELPLRAAFRELEEETTLRPDSLDFFMYFSKDPRRHTWGGLIHVFIARDIDEVAIDVREGQGYVLLDGEQDLDRPDCSVITADILRLFYRQRNGAATL